MKARRHVGQEAKNRKLPRANAEAPDGKGENDERDMALPNPPGSS